MHLGSAAQRFQRLSSVRSRRRIVAPHLPRFTLVLHRLRGAHRSNCSPQQDNESLQRQQARCSRTSRGRVPYVRPNDNPHLCHTCQSQTLRQRHFQGSLHPCGLKRLALLPEPSSSQASSSKSRIWDPESESWDLHLRSRLDGDPATFAPAKPQVAELPESGVRNLKSGSPTSAAAVKAGPQAWRCRCTAAMLAQASPLSASCCTALVNACMGRGCRRHVTAAATGKATATGWVLPPHG